MNLFKLFYRSGRQDIVRGLLVENVTPDAIVTGAAGGINKLLNGFDDKERIKDLASKANRVSKVALAVASAFEDGFITEAEAREIASAAGKITGDILTQEKISDLIEAIVAKVP